MRNKFYLMALSVLVSTVSLSQTINVKRQTEKVKTETVDGASTELAGKLNDVNAQWTKFMKEIGRVKLFSSAPVVITEPNLNGTVYPNGILYAHIFESGSQTRVWLGILPAEWNEKDVNTVNKQIEGLIYQFGIRYNRYQVQLQIDEAKEASDAVERQRLRLVNQNKDLTNQLVNNEREKTQLEKSLDNNKLEKEALKIKLEKNKRAQDSLVDAASKIEKMKAYHQERLRRIN